MVSDLTSFLSKKKPDSIDDVRCDLVVSTDNDLVRTIIELYTTEGFSKPKTASYLNEDNVGNYTRFNTVNVILDLRGVDGAEQGLLVAKMETLLDVDINLMILSDINSINLQNEIYRMGAIYVLWDKELNGLNMALNSSTSGAVYSHSIRSAKRILVIGTRGGIGVSSFSAMLAHTLAVKAHLKVLLSEHDSHALISDACLGIKQLKLKQNSGNLAMVDLDAAIATSYIHNVQDKLDYLAIDSHLVSPREHVDLLYYLSQEMAKNYNFIIDSVPLSCVDTLNVQENLDRYHRVFLICEPTIASLRTYNYLSSKLANSDCQVIFNLVRSPKDYIMSVDNACERINVESVVKIKYEPSLEKTILQQGISSVEHKKYYLPFVDIIRDLTGKNIKPKLNFSLFKKRS
ncbi:MAG: CpaE family protein [Vibrio sp.]|uniref:AAA family ATPase n=1 Tax=Vibrio sp. TaxID=678 RepID=UPI003A865CDA